ncbi:MAG: RNA-guided endonuclease InsQ/TnpB family protein [Xenococcaceae cyanobacterium]
MYGCTQILINPDELTKAVLEFICQEANKLTNCAIYYARQLWFKRRKIIGKYDLDAELKCNLHFKALRSAVAQQCVRSVYESFTSYKRLNRLFVEGQLTNKPRPPKYRKKGGLTLVSYPSRWLKLKERQIVFSLGKQVKAWFGIDGFTLPMPSQIEFSQIKEVRILPRNNCFYAEFVYQSLIYNADLNPQNALAIDPGLNNWLTCVSNLGKSLILNGRKIKSQNQWYNKKIATLKKNKPQGFWNEELAAITETRNRQMRDNINKAARFLINWCLKYQVGNIIFGWNQGNKDSINIGKKNNQEFVQIPTARLKDRIAQLCSQYGIHFVETEESYSSKASFLSNDLLPTFGENNKPEGWQPSGKRGKKIKGRLNNLGRGGYICPQGWVNSDCNGAANIMRKVSTQLGLSLAEVVRGCLTVPKRYDLFSLSKSYRRKCEEASF